MAVNYGSLITAVGGIAIGAFSAASGNKRAWKALNDRARLAQEGQDFNNELQVTQNYEDYYIRLSESQQAKAKVALYTNTAGFVVLGLLAVGAVYLVKKVTLK
jgi:hypothetical protein